MTAAPVIASPEPAGEAAVPEGATCAVHDGDPAAFVCRRCGTFGCLDCRFAEVKGLATCRGCADKGLGHPIPWERRKELGVWRSFWDTVRLASRSPTRFFRTPTTHESVMPAMAHAVLTSTIGLAISYLAAGLLVMLGGGATAAFAPVEDATALGSILGLYGCFILGMSPLALLAGPANALVGVVYAATAAHAVLALGGKAKGSFEDTLRAVSYANAPYVWQWVPLAGMLSFFWMVGVEVVAIRETHRCGSDWAALAVIAHRVVFALAILGAYAVLTLGMVAALTPPPPP